MYLCFVLWTWYTVPPEAYSAQQCDFSARGGSGTSEAVISVMCFSTWMDGGRDRSMDGWACSMVTVWLLCPCDVPRTPTYTTVGLPGLDTHRVEHVCWQVHKRAHTHIQVQIYQSNAGVTSTNRWNAAAIIYSPWAALTSYKIWISPREKWHFSSWSF